MIEDARPSEVLAYTYGKLGKEGLEELLSLNRISRKTLDSYIAEYKEIGLTALAAMLEEIQAPEIVIFCPSTLSNQSLEDMKDCKRPNGKCGCLLNKAYW
jgi:hypothetical protein